MKNFGAICDGEIIEITSVKDPVFSQKMMGDGFAIIPSQGILCAPLDCTVEMIFPTGHAVGLKLSDEISILIHFGLNSFKLNGNGIIKRVIDGAKVKKGDPLIEVDLELFKEAGINIVTPIIFTTGQKIELLKKNVQITKGETDLFRII